MGANTLRVYTVLSDSFYNAFYQYNNGREEPLYLVQGVWVNDYVQNSHMDAYDDDFRQTFIDDCRTVVDVIHGNKKLSLGGSNGGGSFTKDISPWVLGYIVGVEWEDVTVAYTDEKYPERNSYVGNYLTTTADATPFEAMLAEAGDKMIAYESHRYKEQRLLAFSNWPTTDPFDYPQNVTDFFMKCAKVDVEHIRQTDRFLAGQFASYHVYPYYPDYLSYVEDLSPYGIEDRAAFTTESGAFNSYKAYLSMLTDHHTIPVVISEFGVSTGRGMAQRDQNTGRNQGNMSENGQGEALISCYEDILSTQCAGGMVFSWQDEWFKRTWNTMYAVDLTRTPYWSDYQTNEQYFGLLSFDPGKESSLCYVDGDCGEWGEEDIVTRDGTSSLSMKYDEKFIYLRIHKEGLDFEKDAFCIPIDTTQKTGSNYWEGGDVQFDRYADFVLQIDGAENSRILVQERYEALRSTYSINISDINTYATGNIPEKNSPLFVPVSMILQTATALTTGDATATAETYETGVLTYGNANPTASDFNSLSDFCSSGDDIEIKLPWQLLNFSDPSRMKIHDDYYDGNYGVRHISIDQMYLGLGEAHTKERILLSPVSLTGWGNHVTTHQRLKSSYYMLQEYWGGK